jgi:hypothetical protein
MATPPNPAPTGTPQDRKAYLDGDMAAILTDTVSWQQDFISKFVNFIYSVVTPMDATKEPDTISMKDIRSYFRNSVTNRLMLYDHLDTASNSSNTPAGDAPNWSGINQALSELQSYILLGVDSDGTVLFNPKFSRLARQQEMSNPTGTASAAGQVVVHTGESQDRKKFKADSIRPSLAGLGTRLVTSRQVLPLEKFQQMQEGISTASANAFSAGRAGKCAVMGMMIRQQATQNQITQEQAALVHLAQHCESICLSFDMFVSELGSMKLISLQPNRLWDYVVMYTRNILRNSPTGIKADVCWKRSLSGKFIHFQLGSTLLDEVLHVKAFLEIYAADVQKAAKNVPALITFQSRAPSNAAPSPGGGAAPPTATPDQGTKRKEVRNLCTHCPQSVKPHSAKNCYERFPEKAFVGYTFQNGSKQTSESKQQAQEAARLKRRKKE